MRGIIAGIKSGHWPSLLGAWLHFEVSFMTWLLVGALGVLIAEEFSLSATQKGFLVAVPLLSGALLRVAAGLCSDQYGTKRTGVALLLCELVAVTWGWLAAASFVQMLGVGVLLGVAGASFAVALPIASQAYPPAHQGLALGIAASANSGTVLAMFFAPRLAQLVGWHGVFGLMLIPIGVTLILFVLLVRSDRGTSRQESRDPWNTLWAAMAQPSMYWLCFLYAVTFGGFVGFCSFLPLFLHDQYGVDLVTAGTLTALCGLTGSLIRPLGGYLGDRVGGLMVLQLVYAGMAFCIGLLGMLPSLPLAAVYAVVGVGAMGFGNGAVFQVVSHRFPKQMGLASGLVGAAGGFGGFLLPVCLGSLKDLTGTFQTGLWIFSATAIAAAVSVGVAMKHGTSAQAQERNLVGFSD